MARKDRTVKIRKKGKKIVRGGVLILTKIGLPASEYSHTVGQDKDHEFCSVIIDNEISISCIYNPQGKPNESLIT